MSYLCDMVLFLKMYRYICVGHVRGEYPDLSMRQMAIILTVYSSSHPQTVRWLSHELKLSKPVVSRALDRLGHLGFVRRQVDEKDRRSILIHRTVKGSVFLHDLSDHANHFDHTFS